MTKDTPKGIEVKGQIVDVHPRFKMHSNDSMPEQYIEVKFHVNGLDGETIKQLTRYLNTEVGILVVPEQMVLPGLGEKEPEGR